MDEIQPNPFRDIERYPLDDKKIKAFRESFRVTGFWHNLPARLRKDGKPEIVFGHHRVEALRQEFGGDFEVRLVIEDLSDEMMLKRMFWENREEWKTNALVDQASIRAVVDAHADGRVELPTPNPNGRKDRWRYAPSFRQGDVAGAQRQRPYTVATVADSLGLDRTKVESTLAALELIERKMVAEDRYDGLTQTQASVLTNEVRKVVSDNHAKAKEYEKEADAALKEADAAKSDKERTAHEKLAESALQQANAVRKGVQEEVDYVVNYVTSAFQEGAATRAVSARLKRLRKPPPLPQPHDNEPDDQIAEFLDRWPEYTAHALQVLPLAKRFSPEQIDEGRRALGQTHEDALAAVKSAWTEVECEREQRCGARSERSGKEKQKPKRRYDVPAKRRRRGAKAGV